MPDHRRPQNSHRQNHVRPRTFLFCDLRIYNIISHIFCGRARIAFRLGSHSTR